MQEIFSSVYLVICCFLNFLINSFIFLMSFTYMILSLCHNNFISFKFYTFYFFLLLYWQVHLHSSTLLNYSKHGRQSWLVLHVLCMHAQSYLTLGTCQAPLSMRFSRQEYWSGLPFPSPGSLPEPGIKPKSLMSPGVAGSLPLASPGKQE